MSDHPESYRAIELTAYNLELSQVVGQLRQVERPWVDPAPGEVVVRVEAAPCNPSDLMFLQGLYGVRKPLPTVPGWEGAGTVVAVGAGVPSDSLMGARVAVFSEVDRDGTWAEYITVGAATVVPLHPQVSAEAGATLLVNPLSVIGMMDRIREGKHAAAIQTAAAGQLGRMLLTEAKLAKLPMIHIVRRPAQVELLRGLGGEHVLDSSDETFDKQLAKLARELKATVALDAIAGDMPGRLLKAMPQGSTAVVYGALSYEPCGPIHPLDIIFRGQAIEGFYLGTWMEQVGRERLTEAVTQVQQRVLAGEYDTAICGRVKLDAWPAALAKYAKDMTAGKQLLVP